MDKFDTLIGNLKIVAMLTRNGRLRRTPQGTLTIEANNFWVPFRRFLLSNSRQETLQDLNFIYGEAFNELTRLLSDKETNEWQGRTRKVEVLFRTLKNSLGGLENLKSTYSADVNMLVNTEILIEKSNSLLSHALLSLPCLSEDP